jgi:DUF4097 and DUF4098 domain-containing protein YvlB
MTLLQRQFGGILLATLVGGCAVLCAQDSGAYQGTVPAHPKLVVRTEHGNVVVHGKAGLTEVQWSAHRLSRGSRRSSGGSVRATVSGETLTILVIDMDADVTVQVPSNLAQVTLRSGSGDVALTDIAANADLETEAGSVQLDHVAGRVTGRTGGGNITLHSSGSANTLSRLETGGGNVLVDAAGGNVLASSGGGNINVTAQGSVRVDDGGGNVTVRQAGGAVQLETGGGNVEMGDIGGDVFAETGGGSIHLASARGMVRAETAAGGIDCRQLGSGLRAETGSGAIVAEYARNLHFAESKIETGNGDVTVWMPDTLAAAVKVMAQNPFGHTIRADFDAVRVTRSKDEGELHAEGLMNGGGPLLRVETANGNVLLLRSR